MTIRGQDIVSVLKQQIEQFGTAATMVDVGSVIEVGDGIARIHGLASAKYNGQKIYLGQGIYADLTLTFSGGQFHPLENTFPDFISGAYNEIILKFRNSYKSQLNA